MAVIKCKMCGGDLLLVEGSTIATCEYCGTTQTVPSADNEKKLTLFARANRLRAACEFDKAAGIYESIVADFPDEAESYWGLVLCKYGIEYVDDPASGKKIPTCHRSSFDSILHDSDFDQALENADAKARRVYLDEAKQLEEIRKGIIAVSNNEQPYDIFICYKETDDNGQRTLDSVLAQDIYDALSAKEYRVFFSRITLEDKLGMEYEPYIFAALNSAKVMLVVGSEYEYFNAVWVKNEWSRFLKLMTADKTKHLIPCYRGIDAYDMPKEFARVQAQDMGKVGAMQDLIRGIEKLLPKQEQVIIEAGSNKVASLLDRGFMALEDGEWKRADTFFEEALNNDSKNPQGYLGKLMAELRVPNQAALKDCQKPFDNLNNYRKVIRFADAALITELEGYLDQIRTREALRAQQEQKETETQPEEKSKKRSKLPLVIALVVCAVVAILIATATPGTPVAPVTPVTPAIPTEGALAPVPDYAGPCEELILEESSVLLVEYMEQHMIDVEVRPANTADSLRFTSSNEQIATVDSEGCVTALAEGQCVITVSCGSIFVEYEVICLFPGQDIQPGEIPTSSVETGAAATVDASNLNVRSQPRDDADILKRLMAGTPVEILEQRTVDGIKWGRIAEGWIQLQYVTFDGSGTGIGTGSVSANGAYNAVINASALIIRRGPGSNYDSVGEYAMGDKITILERKNVDGKEWGRTDKGWIRLQYVTFDGSGTGIGTGSVSANGSYNAVINVGALNIRGGPGSNYDRVGVYAMGDKITILERKNVDGTEWGRTDKGWIMMMYVNEIP